MSKNKFVIDFRRLALTENQCKDLHTAIHQIVSKQLKFISDGQDKSNPTPDVIQSKTAIKAATTTAVISVNFSNTNPGDSELSAILRGNKQTINQSGTITINQVKSGDIITISGESLGSTTATIDISADPTQMNFPPGPFDDDFFIN